MPYFYYRRIDVEKASAMIAKVAEDLEQAGDDKAATLAREIVSLLERLEAKVARHVKPLKG